MLIAPEPFIAPQGPGRPDRRRGRRHDPHTESWVLETGGPVAMPWLDRVGAVVEAWYPGGEGGAAIADVLLGKVNPSGHLPIPFPASVDQSPPPQSCPGLNCRTGGSALRRGSQRRLGRGLPLVRQDRGQALGFRSALASELQQVRAYLIWPFSRYAAAEDQRCSFTVANTGAVAGADVPQVYLMAEPHRTQQRLVGFARVDLQPGETRRVTVTVDPRLLANWDSAGHDWEGGRRRLSDRGRRLGGEPEPDRGAEGQRGDVKAISITTPSPCTR